MVNLAKGFSECSLNCECECEAVRFQERGRRWVDVIMARSSTVQRLRYNVDDVKIIWWGGGGGGESVRGGERGSVDFSELDERRRAVQGGRQWETCDGWCGVAEM